VSPGALRVPKLRHFHTSLRSNQPIILPRHSNPDFHPANRHRKRRDEVFLREVEKNDSASVANNAIRAIARLKQEGGFLSREKRLQLSAEVRLWQKDYSALEKQQKRKAEREKLKAEVEEEARKRESLLEDIKKIGAHVNMDPAQEENAESQPQTTQQIKPGLERITALLDRLGNPQDKLKVVHVAGTNGKGSVCGYMTNALIKASMKVGTFTSPHLLDRWDGISIGGKVIEEDIFLELEKQVNEICRENHIPASSFEVITACALWYFAQQNVDIAIIEAGMGGLDDATNVFKNPLVTVITSISLDHVAHLGPTIEDIARHKAGIIKPSCPVVTTENQPGDVQEIIEETAQEKGSQVIIATGEWRNPGGMRYIVHDVHFRRHYGHKPISRFITVPGIAGAQQATNIACAVRALAVLEHHFPQISEEAIQNGIAATKLRGRMEWVRWNTEEKAVNMLLDGAHNPASCAALASAVEDLRAPGRPLIWLVSFSQGRDYRECMGLMIRPGDTVACVEFGPVDGMDWVKPVPSSDLFSAAEEVTALESDVKNFGSKLQEAIDYVVNEAKGKKAILVATGSLYLAASIHRLQKADGEIDIF